MAPGDSEPRRGWILFAMTAVLSMVLMNETTVSVALPAISRQFDLGVRRASWVVNLYILTFASFVAFGGRLGDLFGRRNVLAVGTLVFAGGALACGLSSSFTELLVARGVQGVGAALMVPASAAIITNVFPMEERGRAMAIYAGLAQVFLALGPIIGGAFTQTLGWGWAFFLNLPVTGFCWVAMLVGRLPNRFAGGATLDVRGALLLPLGLGGIVLGLQEGSAWGWASAPILSCFGFGAVVLVAFVALERRITHPLLEMPLFRIPAFRIDGFILFCIQGSIAATAVFGAVYLQHVLGLDPVDAGVAMMALALPVLLATQVAGRIFDRHGARPAAIAGLLLAASGGFWLGLTLSEQSYLLYAAGLALLGSGLGLALAPINTDALSRLPTNSRGQGSGVLQTIRQTGGAFGIAAMTAIVSAVTAATGGPADAVRTEARAFAYAFAFAGALNAFAALAAWFLPRGRQMREPVDLEDAVRLGRGETQA